jgi:hypothetical protein
MSDKMRSVALFIDAIEQNEERIDNNEKRNMRLLNDAIESDDLSYYIRTYAQLAVAVKSEKQVIKTVYKMVRSVAAPREVAEMRMVLEGFLVKLRKQFQEAARQSDENWSNDYERAAAKTKRNVTVALYIDLIESLEFLCASTIKIDVDENWKS